MDSRNERRGLENGKMAKNFGDSGIMKDKSVFWKNTIVVLIGALICCFLWGSAFPFIKIGYRLLNIDSADTASQILFGGVRFTIAGVMAVIIGSVIQRKVLVPRRDEIGRVAFISLFQTIGQYILFYIGMAHTSGVRGAIIEGSNVFVAIIVASLIFKQEKLTAKKIIGSIIGFVGVVVINVAGKSLGAGSVLRGDLMVFLSTFCYAVSSVLLKRYSDRSNTVMISGYQFILGGMVMSAAGLVMGGCMHITSTQSGLVLGYLAFISAVAYSLWGILLKYNSVSRVSVIGFMNPVFGVILSAYLLDEGSGLGMECLVALILICIGIVVVNREERSDA